MINIKTIAPYLFMIPAILVNGCNWPGKEGKPAATIKQQYRCPMHHEIVRDKPGNCPICGMDLVPFGGDEKAIKDVDLNTLLKPTNSYVISTIPTMAIQH